MKYVFISGIPTAGKSYLSKKVAQKTGCIHVDIDKLRNQMGKNPDIEPWINFFCEKDENKYWENVTPQEHWNNLVKQSEAFWPTIVEKIHDIQKNDQSAIFEGVNILPHLAHQDLDFPGIVLLGDSEQTVFERCNKDPRWGKTHDLQKKEATWFFVHEGEMYKQEADKYGYKTFNDTKKAEEELIKLMGK
ncbi:MAG: hypothetical protein V1652_04025 [bacterium]